MDCAEPACTRRCLPGSELCGQHKCMDDTCNLSRAGSLPYCYLHTCSFPGCNRPNGPGMFDEACSSHKCKLSSCNSIREPSRDHCAVHKCGKNTCNRARGSDTEGCEDHTCRLRDANNKSICYKLVQGTPGSASCAKHACGRCLMAYISDEIPYCSRHRCQWASPPCPQVSEHPSRFCEQHKCPIYGCTQSCPKAGIYCDAHKCHYQDGACSQPSIGSQGSWHCQEHTCPVTGCIKGKLPAGLQCADHTCVWRAEQVRCNVEAKEGGLYCTQHRCMESRCSNPRAGKGEGTFCAQHVCVVNGCFDQRGSSAGYCRCHQAEYQPTQTAAVVTVRQSNSMAVQSQQIQAYGTAFLDGYMKGVNDTPEKRQFAQRWMAQNWPQDTSSAGLDGQWRAQIRQEMEGVTDRLTQTQMQLEGLGTMSPTPLPNNDRFS